MKTADFVKYAKEISATKTFPLSQKKFSGEQADFVLNNIDWLGGWFENPEPTQDPLYFASILNPNPEKITRIELPMQIFHNSFLHNRRTLYTQDELNERKYEHGLSILRSAVFGTKELNAHPEGASFEKEIPRTMSGFCEQKGRMPTPADNAGFVYLAGNSIKRWFGVHGDPHRNIMAITSECCLVIR